MNGGARHERKVLFSRIKSRPQIGRNQRAGIFASPKHQIASACDDFVETVPERLRNRLQERRYDLPSSAEPPQNVYPSLRAQQQCTVMSLHNHAIGQSHALRNRNSRLECFSMQRGKSECRSRAILPQNELYGIVTESAVPVVKQELRG